jgi:hypothetical protein
MFIYHSYPFKSGRVGYPRDITGTRGMTRWVPKTVGARKFELEMMCSLEEEKRAEWDDEFGITTVIVQ